MLRSISRLRLSKILIEVFQKDIRASATFMEYKLE